MKKTTFDENHFCFIVRGGLRRKILVENDIITFESVCSSFFVRPRRPSAKNPGEKWRYKL